eukprot:gnl/Chilomastix_cuspidata/817.p1 GENE.gnl/Chilomastix_cuspidata/817~~gnl/Chilomastix_cuspidata/817.p1  ORF type:complete len:302 (-),score=86.67 gnl/Chilomastix_cuspidata/817:711-1616(-)
MTRLLSTFSSKEVFESGYTVVQCFSNPDTSNCIHASVLFAFSFVTFLLGLVFLVLSIKNGKSWLSSKNVLLFLGTVNCLLVFVNYGFSHQFQFAVFNSFLTISQTLLLAYHFLDFFLVKVKDGNAKYRRIMIPLFSVVTAAVLALAIYFCCQEGITCVSPYWIILTSVGFVFAVLFAIASVWILMVIAGMDGSSAEKRRMKKEILIPMFFNLVGFLDLLAYDICELVIARDDDDMCDVFVENQWWNDVIYIVIKVLYLVVPVWGLLIVFRPERAQKQKLLKGRSSSYDSSFFSSSSSNGFV